LIEAVDLSSDKNSIERNYKELVEKKDLKTTGFMQAAKDLEVI